MRTVIYRIEMMTMIRNTYYTVFFHGNHFKIISISGSDNVLIMLIPGIWNNQEIPVHNAVYGYMKQG